MKKILIFKLKIFAKLILLREKPLVIGITGSVGKSSAKEALSLVLSKKFKVRATYKNYNNEIGLPLTIIGAKSPGKNIFSWFLVFFKALKIIIFGDSNYPEILILEMGIDRPGDLKYLCSLAKPKIGIVSSVSYAHIEYFGSLLEIKKEKETLVKSLQSQGTAILNFDNEFCKEMAEASRVKVISYGLKEGADLIAQNINYNFDKGDYELSGINFKLNFRGSIVPVLMKNALSPGAIYAALAATACALELGLNLVDIAYSLKDFALPKGRMNVLPGINNSFIIDDSYNSSPEACLSALEVLGSIKIEAEAKKYAILGDMLEIGAYAEEGHRLVGEKVVATKVDVLITVGDKSKIISQTALKNGLSENNIFHFYNNLELIKFLLGQISPGDIILVKGSQGMRLEKIVKEIMAEKDRANELLVRQGEGWS
ncbi:hypothetical protein JXK06_01005 [Patescibacteria group bacterium]|nr:hypothetical protein [Patescibacteria group bacterium]